MEEFKSGELKKLYFPPIDSHKGQNGKLLIIAGSGLFHAPAIWAAEIASRIVDMVYVSSTKENNRVLENLKGKFWDGIVVRRENLDEYAKEADCILIGPGLPRKEGQQEGDEDSRELTKYVLTKLTKRSTVKGQRSKVVVDGGALQVMDLSWIRKGAILTPHRGEWNRLIESSLDTKFSVSQSSLPARGGNARLNTSSNSNSDNLQIPRNSNNGGGLAQTVVSAENLSPADLSQLKKEVNNFARQHECIVLLKGQEDIVCSYSECRVVKGGNAGMTKGGTGDVLAGLVAALACKNESFLAAAAGSYINKAAADALYKKVGYNFNSSDLVKEIPEVMRRLISY